MHHRRASSAASIHKSIQEALNNPPDRRRTSQGQLAGSEASDPNATTDSPSRPNSPSSWASWSPSSSQPSLGTFLSMQDRFLEANDKTPGRKQNGSERQKWHEKTKRPATAWDRSISTYCKVDFEVDKPGEDDEDGRADQYDPVEVELSIMSKTLSTMMQIMSTGLPVPKIVHPILMGTKLALVTYRAVRKYFRQRTTSHNSDAPPVEPETAHETFKAAKEELEELNKHMNDLKERSVNDLSEVSFPVSKLEKFNSQMQDFKGYLTSKGYVLNDDEAGPRTEDIDYHRPRHSRILQWTGEDPWRSTTSSPARSTGPSQTSLRRGTTIELEERLNSLGPRPLSPDNLRRVQSLQPTLPSSYMVAEDSVSSTESEHSTPEL